MGNEPRATAWYGLTGLAFVEWIPLAALSAFWLGAAALGTMSGRSVIVFDWRGPYLAAVCSAALVIAGVMITLFHNRKRGAKRLTGPAVAVALGFIFIAMIAIVGD